MVLSVEACLALGKIYIEQIQKMTAVQVRITSAISENNIATVLLPGDTLFQVSSSSPQTEKSYLIKKVVSNS